MKVKQSIYYTGAVVAGLLTSLNDVMASNYAKPTYQSLEERVARLEAQTKENKFEQKSILSDIDFSARVYYTYVNDSEKDTIDNTRLKKLKFQASKTLNEKSSVWISFMNNSDNDLTLEEMYYTYRFSDKFRMQFGQMLYPFNIESDKATNNEAMPYDTLGIYDFFGWRGIGATGYFNSGEFGLALGVYGNASNEHANKAAAALRTYYAPYHDGNRVVHIGLNYLQETRDDPEVSANSSYIKEGMKVGLELAANWDAFNAQVEYAFGNVKAYQLATDLTTSTPDKDISTYYIELSYMLTGESKRYSDGTFGGPNVANPVGKGGWGAFELATRYTYTDGSKYDDAKNILGSSEDLDSEEHTEYGIGINWMPINNIKVLLHYVHVEHKDSYTKLTDRDDQINLTGRIFF